MMAESVPNARGWQVGKSLQQCLAELLHNQNMTDITLVVTGSDGKSQSFPAHKLILAARSPVFEAMFSGNFSETSKNQVDIIDTEVEAFQEMLRYMYSDEMTLTGNNVLTVLQLARRYILDGLADECTRFLKESVTPENVSHLLSQSVARGEETVSTNCLHVAWSQWEKMFNSSAFLDMSQDALVFLLSSDVNEYEYFESGDLAILEAVLKWAEHRSELEGTSLRECIGDGIVHNIRFSTLTAGQFASLVGKTQLLNDREMTAWFSYLSVKTDDDFQKKLLDLGFSVTPRCSAKLIKRGSRQQIYNGRATESVSVQVNKATRLRSFVVYGGVAGTKHDVTVTVQNPNTGITHTAKVNFTADGSDKLFHVPLPDAIHMPPSHNYTISANINSAAFCYSTRTSFNDNDLTVTTQQNSWSIKNYCTIIAGFLFSK